jgi:ATP-dependent DNA ligase
VSASFPMERRRELLDELAPYRLQPGDPHPWLGGNTPARTPGAMVSRWNAKKDLTFEPLAPSLVVEVAYDHMEGRRFRHTAQFRHWRPDRDPRSCTYEQLERPIEFDLTEILKGRAGVEEP